jgi:quercetin dioxygenase-like cupin family protein
MNTIHHYKGQFDWDGVDLSHYPLDKEMQGVSVRWLIGPADGAANFAMRYFEIEPGGWTSLDQHAHDHGVFVLRGRGQILLGQIEHQVAKGDVVYIPPNDVHQLKNVGEKPFGFLCVIPPKETQSPETMSPEGMPNKENPE